MFICDKPARAFIQGIEKLIMVIMSVPIALKKEHFLSIIG
jgi:hypothetical protein